MCSANDHRLKFIAHSQTAKKKDKFSAVLKRSVKTANKNSLRLKLPKT